MRTKHHILIATLIERKVDVVYQINNLVKDYHLAEDLYQDAYIKCQSAIDRGIYKEENKPYNYAVFVAKNIARDYLRANKGKRIKVLDEDVEIGHTETKENALLAEDTRIEVLELIEKLSPAQREVVVLRTYNKKQFKDIAKLIDISINTSVGRYRYAVAKMRKLSNN